MAQVLDYSAGVPGAAAIKAAGYVGAVRYIGFPTRRKCTSAAELADFTRHGLGMALVYEDTADDWRGGRARGREAGARARAHATQIGFPTSRPIYMAVDRDVVTDTEFAAAVEYLRGAAETLGGVQLTGVYGEHDVCARAAQAGAASWFWQCRAWSGTPVRLFAGRHLYQRVGTVRVGGIDCDINDALQPDWGQHTMEDHVLKDETFTFTPPGGGKPITVSALDMLGNLYAERFYGSTTPPWAGPSGRAIDLAELAEQPPAVTEEFAAQVADELAQRGVGGATPAQVQEAVRAAFAKAGQQ